MMILYILIAVVLVYCFLQFILCLISQSKMRHKLDAYQVSYFESSLGKIAYIVSGNGVPVLSIHGMSGGYDQAYETFRLHEDDCMIIAPSRFGYLGSELIENATVDDQAKVFIELLDYLKIEAFYVFGVSAGGTLAYKMAFMAESRILGIILYVASMPLLEKPKEKNTKYQGAPHVILHDYVMYLCKPLIPILMGLPSKTVDEMMLLKYRRAGMAFDALVVNNDMHNHFEKYPIEHIKIPMLMIYAKDDKMVKSDHFDALLTRFKNPYECLIFKTGGHLLKGHSQAVFEVTKSFIKENMCLRRQYEESKNTQR